MSNDQIRRLMSSPRAMMLFKATGKLPDALLRPQSPLITLLDSIYPRDRLQITGVVIDHRLGYLGSRTFANAAQALNWLAPSNRPEHLASESACDKRVKKVLSLEDLRACAAVPDAVVVSWERRHRHSLPKERESGPSM
jgi:hypothetical protein